MQKNIAFDNRYKMNHKNRGYAVIIDNYEVAGSSPISSHTTDVQNFRRTFSKLGFNIQIYENLTAQKMLTIMKKYAKEDYSDTDCFVAIFLSHGTTDNKNVEYICGSDGNLASIEELTDPFQINQTLNDKPKIFFFDACRGSKSEPSFAKLSSNQKSSINSSNSGYESSKAHYFTHADFFFGFATVHGYVSYFTENQDSWYSTEVCNAIDKHADTDHLVDMITEAHRIIKAKHPKLTPEIR